MRSRLRAAVLATLAAGIVLTVLSVVVGRSPEQRDEIRQADRVAARYSETVDAYVRRSAAAIRAKQEADQDGYPALLRLVEKTLEDAPDLPKAGTTAYGRRHSASYRDALNRRDASLGSVVSLGTYLRDHAVPDSRFVVAGRKLVELDPAELVGDTPITSGAPLRDLVLPPYEKARKRLKKLKGPEGSDLLVLDLRTYARDVVAMVEKGADTIDEGKPYFLRLGDRPAKLAQRLATFEALIQSEVASRVDVVDAGS